MAEALIKEDKYGINLIYRNSRSSGYCSILASPELLREIRIAIEEWEHNQQDTAGKPVIKTLKNPHHTMLLYPKKT